MKPENRNSCAAFPVGLFLILPALLLATVVDGVEPRPETSIIRVNATLQEYNFLEPWEKTAPTPRRGLGALIGEGRVLTTAEMCVNATYVELEHPSSGAKVEARIVARDYEANLALLEAAVEKPEVFEGIVPLERTGTVKGGDRVEVWQIEDNGDGVSTEVEVLRLTVGSYFVPGARFLLYQVRGSLQARVNSFTLPVVKEGKLAGMLLSYNSKEQTANILPMPIIEAFLADIEDGDYQGFPNLGISFAQTLDEHLREFCGIEDREGGVFVRKVASESSAEDAGIKVGDVIMKVGEHEIDSRGNYLDPEFGRISFSHLVRGGAQVGDKIQVELIRDAEPLVVDVVLRRKEATEHLVDPFMFDRGPKFYILGGMIFQELTKPYLESWGDSWPTRAPFRLVYAGANPEIYEEEGREKLVFLSNVLKTPSTLGYEGLNSVIVKSVNGKPVGTIRELAEIFENVPEDGIHRIELDDYPKIMFVRDDISREVNRQLLQFGIGQLLRLD